MIASSVVWLSPSFAKALSFGEIANASEEFDESESWPEEPERFESDSDLCEERDRFRDLG